MEQAHFISNVRLSKRASEIDHLSEKQHDSKRESPGIQKTARAVAALLIVLSLSFLGACAPKFVGEAAAKEAGLALLRQAFGITAKDAHVEYFERAGTSAVDNTDVHSGSKTPNQIYLVTISDQTLGADLYYAEVDAKTGVAYYAMKNEWLLAPQTPDQNQSIQSNTNPDDTDADETAQEDGAKSTACAFVMRRFQKDVSLITAQGCCHPCGNRAQRGSIGYFVTFADGALYRVGFSWPAMDMNEIQVLGNGQKGARP